MLFLRERERERERDQDIFILLKVSDAYTKSLCGHTTELDKNHSNLYIYLFILSSSLYHKY